VIDEIAKDNENDQSNQRVTLLCALHLLALTSLQSVGKGGEPPYGFAFRTPEDVTPLALQDVACLRI
jgi:hypothetical protein